MKHLLRPLILGALFSAACTTTDSHIARRRAEVRAAQAGPLVERWNAIRADPHSRGARLKLAFEVLEAAQGGVQGLNTDEIKAILADDLRALSTDPAPANDPSLFATAERLAVDVLRDEPLAHAVVCQGSTVHEKAYSLHLRCGALASAAGATEQAVRAWRAAYFAATEPGEQCEPIRRVATASLHPERDLTGFSAAVVRRCSAGVGAAAAATQSPAVPSPGTAPTPHGHAASTQAEGAGPSRAQEAAPVSGSVVPAPHIQSPPALTSSAVTNGFELRADVVQPSATLGNIQLAAPVQLGYGMPNGFVGIAPVLGITSSEAQGATVRVSAVGVSPSGRYYFAQRAPHQLNGYLRADVLLASVTASASAGRESAIETAFLFGVMGGGGAEYLLTPHFGVTADVGVRALFVNNDSSVSAAGNIGIVLHHQ